MICAATFTLDAVTRTVTGPVERRLIDVLREDLAETSAKKPCGSVITRCQVCTKLAWVARQPGSVGSVGVMPPHYKRAPAASRGGA